MNCKNCNANLPENVTECPSCDAKTEQSETQQNTKTGTEKKPLNPFKGKDYTFVSSYGTVFLSPYGRVTNSVSLSEDKMSIDTWPKKYNIAPEILFNDITSIKTKVSFTLASALITFMCLIAAFVEDPIYLLFIPVGLWLSKNTKISISRKNNEDVVIYSGSKSAAVEFADDIKTIKNIN